MEVDEKLVEQIISLLNVVDFKNQYLNEEAKFIANKLKTKRDKNGI